MRSPRKIAVAGTTGSVMPAGALFTEAAGPREESLVAMARLLAARRGYPTEIEGVSDPLTQTASSTRTVPCFPAPAPSSPAPPLRVAGLSIQTGLASGCSPELHQTPHREEPK